MEKERMQEARERMQEAKERILEEVIEEFDDEDTEDSDEDWVDCENVDYEEVEYTVYDGEALATILFDSEIEHLVIPEVITDEEGNKHVVTEFDIEDLESVTRVTLPKTVRRVYGWAFGANTNVAVDFAGEPALCFEKGVFYSKDKKELQNAKLANVAGEYTVEEGVEEIAIEAFGGCEKLRVLNLPSTIKTIHPAFCGCSALQVVNIYADAANVVFSNLDGDDEEVEVLPKDVQVNYVKPVIKTSVAETTVSKTSVAKAPVVPTTNQNKQKVEEKMPRKLTLSSTDKKLLGVCGGIATWLGINSALVRIIVVALTLIFWIVIPIYFLLKIILPNDNVQKPTTTEVVPTVETAAENGGERVRDYSKYSVNGEGSYGKGRMVEAVVNKYVELNPGTTVQKLKEVFPEHLQGSNFIKDSSEKITDMKRYYESALQGGGVKFYISNQWGTQTDAFVEYVNNNVDGITVTKL